MISYAYAQAAGQASGESSLLGLLPIVLMFVLLYFMMIRPQMRKAKEHKTMVDALQKGDEVIAMGMIGKIVRMSDNYIGLEVANGTVIHIQKQAITTLLPKGTFNDITK